MAAAEFQSWGRYPRVDQRGIFLRDRHALLQRGSETLLPFGNGRSYGDSCLNGQGLVVSSRRLDRFIDFDAGAGTLRCEAGVLLAEVLELIVPRGWFLPVTPGTQYATVGGAIANDVHGKNHHVKGTFGRHLRQFELLRTDGSRRLCSPQDNEELFSATVGGLGLTGMITWAEIGLLPIPGNAVRCDVFKYRDLEGFFRLSEESDADFDYTQSWLDCTGSGSELGRGYFARGNHAEGALGGRKRRLSVPCNAPFSAFNRFTLPLLNAAIFHGTREARNQLQHYEPFFYPLDGLLNWNRIYGPRGFVQYQCVIPRDRAFDGIRLMLEKISDGGLGSPLAVLKICGDIESPGLMSFPMHGVSLALDFPVVEQRTFALLAALDEILLDRGGRLYPAKDARMSGALFRACFPAWEQVEALRDPGINSDLWRRVIEHD